MSSALPVVSGADVVAALLRCGFTRVSQRGSHLKMRKDDRVVIVPMHRELAQGSLGSVLRQAGLSRASFRPSSDAEAPSVRYPVSAGRGG
ncbi:MAG: type II toxin-antitoxin system HicA family toxin [Acidimicrobiales bacterium]